MASSSINFSHLLFSDLECGFNVLGDSWDQFVQKILDLSLNVKVSFLLSLWGSVQSLDKLTGVVPDLNAVVVTKIFHSAVMSWDELVHLEHGF